MKRKSEAIGMKPSREVHYLEVNHINEECQWRAGDRCLSTNIVSDTAYKCFYFSNRNER